MRVIDKHHSPEEGLSDKPVQQSLAATLDLVASYKIVDDQYSAEAELRHLMIESTATFGPKEGRVRLSSNPAVSSCLCQSGKS